MALQKTISLPNGTAGAYIKLAFFRWDDIRKESSAHFHLYATNAARLSAPLDPLKDSIVKLRLDGAKFDEYFSGAALIAARSTIVGQFYTALKAEGGIAGGGLTSLDLSDAADV